MIIGLAHTYKILKPFISMKLRILIFLLMMPIASYSTTLDELIKESIINNSCIDVNPGQLLSEISTEEAKYILYAFSEAYTLADKENCLVNINSDSLELTNSTGTDNIKVKVGQETYLNIGKHVIKLKANKTHSTICLQLYLPQRGFVDVSCKEIIRESDYTNPENGGCYYSKGCVNNAFNKSKSLLPISSIVIHCVKESLDALFVNHSFCNSNSNKTSNFFDFQSAMRSTVKALLILYVILFGISIALSSEPPEKKEVFLFLTKFILVLYFSVGFSSADSYSGQVTHKDGVTTLVLPFFSKLTEGLVDNISRSGGSTTLCNYNVGDYSKGFSHLAIWDRLDCRILYYLGSSAYELVSSSKNYLEKFMGPALMYIAYAFMGFQVLLFLLALFYVLLLLSITISFLSYVSLAMIGIAITVYLAPIFVPMMLFNATKGFFDKWISLLIGFALQPVIFIAALSIMLTVYDNLVFGSCTFREEKVNLAEIPNLKKLRLEASESSSVFDKEVKKEVPFYILQSSADENCTNSFGYIIRNMKDPTYLVKAGLIFEVRVLNDSLNLIAPLLLLVIFGYIFYEFAKNLAQFTGDLAGAVRIGNFAISPTYAIDTAQKYAKRAVKGTIGKLMGGKKKSGKDDNDDGQGGGPDGGGSTKRGDSISDTTAKVSDNAGGAASNTAKGAGNVAKGAGDAATNV